MWSPISLPMRRRTASRQDYLAASQIGGECRQSLDLIFSPAIFNRNIATFAIACEEGSRPVEAMLSFCATCGVTMAHRLVSAGRYEAFVRSWYRET
jgi:hypothetical protein